MKKAQQARLGRAGQQRFNKKIVNIENYVFPHWYSVHAEKHLMVNKSPQEVYQIMKARGEPDWYAKYISKKFDEYIKSFARMLE